MRLGGLGLISASRISPAAYWSSWADALHMVSQRLPEVANDIVTQLTREPEGCLADLQGAARHLDRCGFVGRPSWEALKAGARPPVPEVSEPGEWLHGWQHHASSFSEYHHRETMVLPQSSAADQAHLRSHSGPGSSSVFHGSQPVSFRTLLLERMKIATPVHRSSMRVWVAVGQVGQAPGSLPAIWQVAFKSIAHGTYVGASVPGSRGHYQMQLSFA